MGCYVSHVCTSIFLYADDILLLAPSISGLQKLLSLCEEELRFLDMRINDKKSLCIRFGSKHDACCAPITTHAQWGRLRWVNTSGENRLFKTISIFALQFQID